MFQSRKPDLLPGLFRATSHPPRLHSRTHAGQLKHQGFTLHRNEALSSIHRSAKHPWAVSVITQGWTLLSGRLTWPTSYTTSQPRGLLTSWDKVRISGIKLQPLAGTKALILATIQLRATFHLLSTYYATLPTPDLDPSTQSSARCPMQGGINEPTEATEYKKLWNGVSTSWVSE